MKKLSKYNTANYNKLAYFHFEIEHYVKGLHIMDNYAMDAFVQCLPNRNETNTPSKSFRRLSTNLMPSHIS